MRGASLVILSLALLVRVLPAAAGVTPGGLRGLIESLDAGNDGTGTLTLGFHGAYRSEADTGQSTSRSHFGEVRLSITYALARFLELGGSVPYRMDYVTDRRDTDGAASDFQSGFGDLETRVKVSLPFGSRDAFRLGAMGSYRFTTGDEAKGYGGTDPVMGLMGLLSLDLSEIPGTAPLMINLNAGVERHKDVQAAAGQPAETDNDLLRLAASIEFPTPNMSFFLEISTEQWYQRKGLGFSDSPIWLTPGARFGGQGENWLDLGVRIGVNPDHATLKAPGWEIYAALGVPSVMTRRDRDRDGAPDDVDACPDTPHGAVVDARGCPIDSDLDGVYDGLDRCPGTPRGAVVDLWGCLLDTDGDGVPDGLDKCPNTPPQVPVDRVGCPLDTDGDGVPDGLDKCPNTRPNTVVDEHGCPIDEDSDGVPDGIDKCPGTPYGAKVDANGCPLDSDGDGVPDGLDKCPDTPYGALVNPDGCPLDEDSDGVPDGIDKCPGTPYGAVVDRHGCPLDSDGDGVPDGLDKCPNTRPGVKVNKWGCPERTRLEGVNFAYNSAELEPESFPILDKVGQLLVDIPEMRVRIEGHTDSDGSDAYNLTLSQRRAEAVRAYLLRTFNIDPLRIEARGFGESVPIASNATPEGKALNRRVEFVTIE